MKRGRYNNVRILFISAIMFFSLLILFLASGQQKAQWNGKIEYKNGIEVIKKGFIYTYEMSKETGYIKVKHYKIKNWEQIREGI